MLVLTREVGQSILIGDDVTITVVRISHGTGQVRLGIEAPLSVSVLRNELRDGDGGGSGTSNSLLACIDDLRVYNRVLAPSEIWTLSGFGGNQALGRGIAFQRRDQFVPYSVEVAAGFQFPRRQRRFDDSYLPYTEPLEYEV